MTRKEELNEVLKALESSMDLLPLGASDDVKRNLLLNQILGILSDIALSLATICDKYKED